MPTRLALRSFAALALLTGALATPASALRPSQPGTPHQDTVCGYTAWARAYNLDGFLVEAGEGLPTVSLYQCQNQQLVDLLDGLYDEGFAVQASGCKPVYCTRSR